MGFVPNYKNLENAARNLPTDRIPLYEHNISPTFMEGLTGTQFAGLQGGTYQDKLEFFRQYSGFQRDMGYDAVTFEGCVTSILPGAAPWAGTKRA